MREVISDTSVLQYLHQADCLTLLRALYGAIVVPEGVAEEILEGRRLGHSLPDLDAISWIRVTSVTDRRVLLMVADLGKGERESQVRWRSSTMPKPGGWRGISASPSPARSEFCCAPRQQDISMLSPRW